MTTTLLAEKRTAFSFSHHGGTWQLAASLRNSVRTVVAARDIVTLMTCPGSGTLAPSCCDVVLGVMAASRRAPMQVDDDERLEAQKALLQY